MTVLEIWLVTVLESFPNLTVLKYCHNIQDHSLQFHFKKAGRSYTQEPPAFKVFYKTFCSTNLTLKRTCCSYSLSSSALALKSLLCSAWYSWVIIYVLISTSEYLMCKLDDRNKTKAKKKRPKPLSCQDLLTDLCFLYHETLECIASGLKGLTYCGGCSDLLSAENDTHLQCYQVFWNRQSMNLTLMAQNISYRLWTFNSVPTNGFSAASVCWVLSTASRRSLAGTNAESRWAVNELGWAQKHLLPPALR